MQVKVERVRSALRAHYRVVRPRVLARSRSMHIVWMRGDRLVAHGLDMTEVNAPSSGRHGGATSRAWVCSLVRRRLVRAHMQGSPNRTEATLMHRSIKIICAAVRLGTSEFSLPPIVSGFRRFRGIRRVRIGDGLRLTCTNDSFHKWR